MYSEWGVKVSPLLIVWKIALALWLKRALPVLFPTLYRDHLFALLSCVYSITDQDAVIVDRSLEGIERSGKYDTPGNVITLDGGQGIVTPKTGIPDEAGKCGWRRNSS